VTDTLTHRLALLHDELPLLAATLRGIEKEGLRIDSQGRLAATPHPQALGSALTHPRITTDYSEALLELITQTHTDVASLLDELRLTHRYVATVLDEAGETMWNHSMPGHLPSEADIPIAWYGTSNTGMLKHVYRRGLAERYGKRMQCIAGVHYNFSLHDDIWELLALPGATREARRSHGYIALIRNFTRYSWLLMYLFGASPAVARDFLPAGNGRLQSLDADTLYLPYATSLRMSDLGYQSPVQAQLKLCYNDLDTFLARLHDLVTHPWPDYARLGTHRDGQWIQLNTHILQIENEYYSTIRPKRVTERGERPITALAERGVQYVEVRCLDIDPFAPQGISADTARFLDAFLLYCALQESPRFTPDGHCDDSAANFAQVVRAGRTPGLRLKRDGVEVVLPQWGHALLDGIATCATLLDAACDDADAAQYARSVAMQRGKLDDPATTPSGQFLATLTEERVSFYDYARELSRTHARTLCGEPLSASERAGYTALARESLAEQARIEASDVMNFDRYVARYQAALRAPAPGTSLR